MTANHQHFATWDTAELLGNKMLLTGLALWCSWVQAPVPWWWWGAPRGHNLWLFPSLSNTLPFLNFKLAWGPFLKSTVAIHGSNFFDCSVIQLSCSLDINYAFGERMPGSDTYCTDLLCMSSPASMRWD